MVLSPYKWILVGKQNYVVQTREVEPGDGSAPFVGISIVNRRSFPLTNSCLADKKWHYVAKPGPAETYKIMIHINYLKSNHTVGT